MAQKECIPLYTPGTSITVLATADVKAKQFVKVSAAMNKGLIKVAPPSAKGAVFGVAVRDALNTKRTVALRGKGNILPVVAGAAIAALAELEVDANGKVVTWTDGVKVGRALDAAAGDLSEIFIELY